MLCRTSICVLVLVLSLSACDHTESPEISGSLYFGSGNYLARLNLRNHLHR